MGSTAIPPKKSCLTKAWKDFGLDTVPPIFFWRSEWEDFNPRDVNPRVSVLYLLYRLGYLVFFIIGLSISMGTTPGFDFYFVYLTNLTFILQSLYGLFYFVRLLFLWRKQRAQDHQVLEDTPLLSTGKGSRLPWPEKVIWVLINIVSAAPYIVTLGYWVILFDPKIMFKESGYMPGGFIEDLFVHTFNSVVTIMDVMVMAVPIRLTHFVYPIAYGVLYSTFTGFYELWNGQYWWKAGGEYIYPPLNWRHKPGIAVFSATAATIFAGLLHSLMAFGGYKLRAFLSRNYGHRKGRDQVRDNLSIKESDSVIQVEAVEPNTLEPSSTQKDSQLEPRKKSSATVAV